MISVQQFFEDKYKDKFKKGMRYPNIPCINFGSNAREDLVPAELGE